MLVLSRFIGERITIGDDIVIEVVDIRKAKRGDSKVRLGIQAPRSIPIHRQEVYDAINEQFSEAAEEDNPIHPNP
jgi:carbon storage regulator